jgi:hypothetical protein
MMEEIKEIKVMVEMEYDLMERKNNVLRDDVCLFI